MKKILAAFLLVCSFASCSLAVDSDGRICLGIMEFESSTYDVPDRKAAEISDIFARILFKSERIRIIERKKLYEIINESKLTVSRLIDEKTAAEAGRIAGCDYVLMGSITNLAKASSGFGIPSFGIPVLSGIGVHNERVKATIDIKIVEVNTGNLFFADTADGLAKKSRTNFIISGVTVTNSEFNGLEVNAILKASAALAPKIEKAITGYDTLTEKLKAETKASRKKKVKTKTESETDTSKQETKQETKQELKPETEKIPETRTETTSANTTEPENKSTDPAKVINSYGLPSGESNVLRIKHINLKKQDNKKNVYQEYTKLFESFNGDYFAAFRAGEVALSMGDETNAKLWFEKSLSVNPNYEPAKKALEKLSDTKTDSKPKPKTKPKTKRKR